MAEIRRGRWTAEIEGDFVVFLIGARMNSRFQAWKAFRDLGGRKGMQHMLDYLASRPDKGLLAYQACGFTFVQYWRSLDHLAAFATDPDAPHLAAWRSYWRRVGTSARTGIWHETFLVRAGEYETTYGNMPPHGLGKAGQLVPASHSSGIRQRLGGHSVGSSLANTSGHR